MTIRFEKVVPDFSIVNSMDRGNKEKHKIFKDLHYVGYIAVARKSPNLVCLVFQAEVNTHLHKWWGEMSLKECKDFVTQHEGDIQLHPDLQMQKHFDEVIATSPVC